MNNSIKVLICFAAHNKWYGKLIRFILGGNFNHVFLAYYSNEWKQWMAIEVIDKVCIIPFEQTCSRYYDLEGYECSCDLMNGIRKTSNYLGKGYDWLGAIGGLFRILMWRWFRWKVKPIQNKSLPFCSEYVAEVLKCSGMAETQNWEPANISIESLRLFVSSSLNCVRLGDLRK